MTVFLLDSHLKQLHEELLKHLFSMQLKTLIKIKILTNKRAAPKKLNNQKFY